MTRPAPGRLVLLLRFWVQVFTAVTSIATIGAPQGAGGLARKEGCAWGTTRCISTYCNGCRPFPPFPPPGLYISYVIPVFLRITIVSSPEPWLAPPTTAAPASHWRLRALAGDNNKKKSLCIALPCLQARKTFERGQFHLGALSVPIGTLAVLWVLFVSCIFMIPTVYPGRCLSVCLSDMFACLLEGRRTALPARPPTYPPACQAQLAFTMEWTPSLPPPASPLPPPAVTKDNLNYASVAVAIVLVFSLGWWVVDARRWFKGPVAQVRTAGRQAGYWADSGTR